MRFVAHDFNALLVGGMLGGEAVRSHPPPSLSRRLFWSYELLVARIWIAHSTATPAPGLSAPGMVAHPWSVTKLPRIQELACFSASSLGSRSPSCWNRATQIGARAWSTAASARSPACFSALHGGIHPNTTLSTIHHATAPPPALHSSLFIVCHFISHLISVDPHAGAPHASPRCKPAGPCFQECSATWPRGPGRPACACVLPSASWIVLGTSIMEKFPSFHPCTSE